MRALSGPIDPFSFRGSLASFLISTLAYNKKEEHDEDERDAYLASQAAYGSNDHINRLNSRGYVKDTDISTENTSVYHNGRKTLVGYRGTTNNRDDYSADSSIAVGLQNMNSAFKTAKLVGERAKNKYNTPIIYTGHSLGGTKAVETGRVLGGKTIVFNPGSSQIAPLDTKHAKVFRTNGDYISFNVKGSKPTVYLGGHSLSNFEDQLSFT